MFAKKVEKEKVAEGWLLAVAFSLALLGWAGVRENLVIENRLEIKPHSAVEISDPSHNLTNKTGVPYVQF